MTGVTGIPSLVCIGQGLSFWETAGFGVAKTGFGVHGCFHEKRELEGRIFEPGHVGGVERKTTVENDGRW
jgi:hypothetical protein